MDKEWIKNGNNVVKKWIKISQIEPQKDQISTRKGDEMEPTTTFQYNFSQIMQCGFFKREVSEDIKVN